jgi:formylglycine-generating enzyme required for sulfatase activity
MSRWLVAIALAPLSLGGCLLSIDDGRIPDASEQGDGTMADVATGADAADAPVDSGASDSSPEAVAEASTDAMPEAGCPAGMVQVPAPDGGGGFCVDSTEVTHKAYAAFLALAEPPASGSQITVCAWNSTYVPSAGTPPSDDVPVGGIDWCDAWAFCAWGHKHLCGAIGGGTLDFNSYPGSPSPSEWYNACSRGGARALPYGNQYNPTWCNGAPVGMGAAAAVGTFPQCVGGYPGLFDMSGNVSEFIDGCSTTPDTSCGTGPDCDLCLLVGGGFLSGADGGWNIDCSYANQVYRSSTYVDNGLRCCADLP